VGGGEQVQHRVGRPAHGDVERIAFSKASKVAMARGRTDSSSPS
jgi:hypothetical protein